MEEMGGGRCGDFGGFEGGDVLDICVRVLCMSLRSRSDCLSVFCVLRALKRLFQGFFFCEKTRVFDRVFIACEGLK